MISPDFAASELERIGLSHLAPQILAYLQPCIAISPTVKAGKWDAVSEETFDETPIGISKLGGHPDVPIDFQWPETEEGPLPFMAQIRLEDIAHLDPEDTLPHQGLLLFFFDHTLEIWHETHVFHAKNPSDLMRIMPPEDLTEFGVLAPYALTFSRGWSLPASQSLEMEAVLSGCNDAQKNAYGQWRHDLWSHQLLGHIFYYNYDERPYAAAWQDGIESADHEGTPEQRQKWRDEAKQWRGLLQFTTDQDENGETINWGDAGSICFIIPEADLQTRNFERVYGFCQ